MRTGSHRSGGRGCDPSRLPSSGGVAGGHGLIAVSQPGGFPPAHPTLVAFLSGGPGRGRAVADRRPPDGAGQGYFSTRGFDSCRSPPGRDAQAAPHRIQQTRRPRSAPVQAGWCRIGLLRLIIARLQVRVLPSPIRRAGSSMVERETYLIRLFSRLVLRPQRCARVRLPEGPWPDGAGPGYFDITG